MTYDNFTKCFEALCLSFDLDFDKKKNRMEYYFDSKLKDLTEYQMYEIIKTARQTLDIKHGALPGIKTLESLYFNMATPKQPKKRGENYHDAICAKCDNTGWVSEDRPEGWFCLGACKCIIGQQKEKNTKLGRELGFYDGSKSVDPVPF